MPSQSVDSTCDFINVEGYIQAMNYKKIANSNYDEIGSLTTRGASRHGLSSWQRREKRRSNRVAKREEERIHSEKGGAASRPLWQPAGPCERLRPRG